MKRLLAPLIFLVLALAACGTTSEVGTGSASDDPVSAESDGSDGEGEPVPVDPDEVQPVEPIAVEPDGGIGDGAEPLPGNLPDAGPVDEEVITDDQPVDGKITTPTEVVINPEEPSELWVRFVGGAAPCTSAYATVLTETPEKIELELVVGITSDALVKSCLAGEFNLRVDVALNEPATGKNIFWTVADSGEDQPVQLTPNLTTDDFVGLTEAEAAAIADENSIAWRTVRVDAEDFAVTMDYSPSRLNFEIDNGVITLVSVG